VEPDSSEPQPPPTKPLGFYINLDRSEDRRAVLESRLAELGLTERFSRIPAVDGRASSVRPDITMRSELGCYLSHLDAIRAGAASGRWTHIIEDDVVISRFMEPVLDVVLSTPQYERFDLILTNCGLGLDTNVVSTFRDIYDRSVQVGDDGRVNSVNSVSVAYLNGLEFFSAASYLINPASIGRVMALLDTELDRAPFTAIDAVYQDLARQRALTIGVTIPFLTLPDDFGLASTIRARSPWRTAHYVIAAALFADRDIQALEALLNGLETGVTDSPTRSLITRAFGYAIGVTPVL
jgi:hypothetical protein